MRGRLSDHTPMVLASVIAVTLIVIGLLFATGQREVRTQPAFTARLHFIDLDTREVFAMELDKLPPLTLDDGRRAVIVHLFQCPHDPSREPIIDHYEKYTDEARHAFDPEEPDAARPFVGRLVSEDLLLWYEANSEKGQAIITPPRCEDGSFAVRIRP